MLRWPFCLSLLLLCALGNACSRAPAYAQPLNVGRLPSEVREASGLAASRRDAHLLWTHNDSGGQPVLYAVEPNGTRRGTVRLAGVKNIDWEDLASFELYGRAWLLVADTGDNTATRSNTVLHIIAEPDPAELNANTELTVPVAWTIPVHYSDGPHDCEAVAVDARAGLVYLLTKRTTPPALYTLPLQLRPAAPAPLARLVSPITTIPGPSWLQKIIGLPRTRYLGQPTALSFAPDGATAAVLTYGSPLIYTKRPNETWADALGRKPEVLTTHGLVQAEALTFAADSHTLYVTGEGNRTAIVRYRPQE
jgi:hypothetical protein